MVALGKGGTGKTMLSISLAVHFLRNEGVVACECDVDAPNLELWRASTRRPPHRILRLKPNAVITYGMGSRGLNIFQELESRC